jgi:hypothetical protein
VLGSGTIVSGLSVTALVLRQRGTFDIPWLVPVLTLIGSAILAALLGLAFITPSGLCC